MLILNLIGIIFRNCGRGMFCDAYIPFDHFFSFFFPCEPRGNYQISLQHVFAVTSVR